MKKILLVLVLMYGVTILSAQIRDTTQPKIPLQFDPDLLFKKARKQKTTAWILLGAGAGVTIAAYAIASDAFDEDVFGFTSSAAQASTVIMLAGVASMIASVPFFISSGKKKKMATILLKNESKSFSRQLHYQENIFSVGVNIKL